MIRVLLVDDQAMVRAGFTMLVDSQDDMAVVGEAGDGAEALERLARSRAADVVLMDVRMPRVDGVERDPATITQRAEAPRVIVLTTFDLDEYAFAAIKAGASAFLLKDAPPGRPAQRDPVGALRRRRRRAEHHPPAARALRRRSAGHRRPAAASTG